MPIFPVEGNVGAGKTTLLNKLKDAMPDVTIVLEPVDEWMNFRVCEKDPSLFELYYKDKTKYGFVFQMMALQTRFESLIDMMRQKVVVVCERSFLTDFKIFAQLMYDSGYLSDIEMAVYKRWHAFIMDLIKPDIGGMIYLRADPEVCLERVRSRGRAGEESVEVEYLAELHVAHEKWLMDSKLEKSTLVIHANGQIDNEAIDRIVEFVTRQSK